MKKEIIEKLKDKTVLITGGTGSLGQALTRKLLETDVKTIRIFSRNENKQVGMESEFNDNRLRFLIGDVRELFYALFFSLFLQNSYENEHVQDDLNISLFSYY